jgi:hypothetical protein
MDDEDKLVTRDKSEYEDDGGEGLDPLPQPPQEQLDDTSLNSSTFGENTSSPEHGLAGTMSEADERYTRYGRPRCDKSRWGVLLHPFGDDDIISRTYSV